MEQLLTLGQFLNEKATREDLVQEQRLLYKNAFKQFEDLNECLDEAMALTDMGIFDGLIYEDFENEELYENLFDKAKEKFAAAKKALADKGKKALSDTQEKILAIGGSISKVIKMIVEALSKAIKEAFAKMTSLGKKATSKFSSQIQSKVEGMDSVKLAEEIKNANTVLKAMKAYVTGGFIKQAANAMQKGAKADESVFNPYAFELGVYKNINEAITTGALDFTDLVIEGEGGPKIPFVSAIAAKVNKIPPFSLLYKVKNTAKDIAGGALSTMSYYATELAGAPGPYKFIALATLIGIAAEIYVKHKASHALVHAVPGLGTIVGIAGNVAYFLAFIAFVETLLKKAES